MEKAVLATPVSDLEVILGKNGAEASRGWLVEERTACHVARAIGDVLDHPERARARRRRAREFFVEHVSVRANARKLACLFERLLGMSIRHVKADCGPVRERAFVSLQGITS